MTSLTFIIPTIGRHTLSQTLSCLINQTNPNWKAIVIFDGLAPTIENPDSRINFIQTEKLGQNHNSAGMVRNYGIIFAETEWIAFVDDDDCLSKNYVELFYLEIDTYKLIELIIFRMVFGGSIMPKLSTDTFHACQVGISFAVKKSIFEEGHIFTPSNIEDYVYLDEIRNNNHKMMISPHITYFVRDYVSINNPVQGNRVFINYDPNAVSN
jgi:glycosyltransferase involved in cell wall biosynthesis